MIDSANRYGDETAFVASEFVEHLRAYFVGSESARRYAGAAFETLGHSWCDDRWINTIRPSVLLARGTFSTPLAKCASEHLLDERFQARATRLLSAIPPDADIRADGAVHLHDDVTAGELYRLIRAVSGMGPTRTSKLLARKGPGLVPIRDRNDESAFHASSARDWWRQYREMVVSGKPSTYTLAVTTHRLLDLSPLATPLRVVDAVLWRSEEVGSGRAQESADVDL
ncbi:DUF6308 family protein [Demequina sp. NBRC 110055]|uniref:DUF6308 family protein n=1 Tax=Demequina sp. NBRC 110055 TaxID=1570344 RepID=UPI001186BFFC|nr:DUF6308 family protein [Demequina sp. NBRC 110055]